MALRSELLPTAAVTTLVAVTITALVTPPDPVMQSLVGIALGGVALGIAVVLTVGGGFARAGLAPAGRDHPRTMAGRGGAGRGFWQSSSRSVCSFPIRRDWHSPSGRRSSVPEWAHDSGGHRGGVGLRADR